MMQYRGVWLPDGEQHLLPEIAKYPMVDGAGTYQLNKLELALSYVRQFRRAADIGAHVGTWARILALRFEAVEAFEPMAAHRACFARNVKAANVTMHPCALGAAEADVRITTYAGNSGHSHIAEDGVIVVPMRTLDSFGFEDLDFLKIDTEGFELQVLRGAVDTLKRCKPVLIVEQKANNGSRYGYDDKAALPFLKKMGAHLAAERSGDYVLVWR